MRKIIPAFFCLVLFFMVCTQAAGTTPFRKYPYLIHGGYQVDSKPSMMILWHTSTAAEAGIQFGTKDTGGKVIYGDTIKVMGDNSRDCKKITDKITGKCTSCCTPIKGYLFQYTIDNLTPGSTTYYRITLGSDSSFNASFNAALDDASKNIVFYGLGDTRADLKSGSSAENYIGVVTQMLKDINEKSVERNTLCIHDGDFVGDGQNREDKTGRDYWDREFFNPDEKSGDSQSVVQFLGSMPIMGVVGNHEGYLYENKFVTDYQNFGQRFKAYFPYPFYQAGKNSFYYSFDYGPVHFSMVDTNNRNDPDHVKCDERDSKGKCLNWAPDQPENEESSFNLQFASLAPKPSDSSPNGQYEWLKNDITNSGKNWNIVVLHNPLYAASDLRDRFSNADGGSVTIRDGLHKLFATDLKGKVKLVIQGHDHYYARSEKDGITYLTLGTGGANKGGKATSYNKAYKASHSEVKAAYDNDCGPGKNIPCFHYARFEITDGSMKVTVKYATKENTSGDIETFNISLDK
jgi:phosphodiesterase/alkaline phosphatase D-like protein